MPSDMDDTMATHRSAVDRALTACEDHVAAQWRQIDDDPVPGVDRWASPLRRSEEEN